MAHEADLNGKLGRHDEEIALLQQLIARQPELPGLHVALAHALKTTGRRDDAIAAARAALAFQPGYAAAWWVVADFKTYVFDDADIEAMKTALAEQPAQADRMQLAFRSWAGRSSSAAIMKRPLPIMPLAMRHGPPPGARRRPRR